MAGKMQMIFCGNKEISSHNPNDGSRYWFVTGPSEDFCSSPVCNNKTGFVIVSSLVYMPNNDGVITVIKPGPELTIISKNPIGEKMYASPAISNGRIYLRGLNHLFCIGTKKAPAI